VADVYGPRMDLRTGAEMAELLAEALQKDQAKLTIHGAGLKVLHPTFVTDVVGGLVKSMSAGDSRGRIFNIVSPHKETVVSFASLLANISPRKPQLVFTNEVRETRLPVIQVDLAETERVLDWRPTVNLSEGLKKTLEFFSKETAPEIPKLELETKSSHPEKLSEEATLLQPFSGVRLAREADKTSQKKISKPKTYHLPKALVVGALVFALFMTAVPLARASYQSGHGLLSLRGSEESLMDGQLDPAFSEAQAAQQFFDLGRSEFATLGWFFAVPGLNKISAKYTHLLTSASETSLTFQYLSEAAKPLLGASQPSGQKRVIKDISDADLSTSRVNLELAERHWLKAGEEFRAANPSFLPPQLRDQLHQARVNVTSLIANIAKTQVSSD
jgi:hypothetical protein